MSSSNINQQQNMSFQDDTTKEQTLISEKAFFDYFYNCNCPPTSLWKPLKDKFRYYKQQSYNTSKLSSELSFIKKFSQISNYIPFVGQIRAEKVQISLIQQIIEMIYDENEQFFGCGGWRSVKNKSLRTHLQEHLLLKLWRMHNCGKLQGGLDKLILGFFYTLNYYKTCNYEIRLFNQFLLNTELEAFFIFVILRKKSRRISKDLTIKSQHVSSFVQLLKGENNFSVLRSQSSENEQMRDVKLLLIYPQIMQYIQKKNGVVLHQILLYSLIRWAELTDESISDKENISIDWNNFLALYFKQFAKGETNYQQELIARTVKANMKIADHLFKLEESNVTFQEEGGPRQKYLEESFGWLIGVLQSIIYGKKQCNQRWRGIYLSLEALYESNLALGNRLVEEILKSQEYYKIYYKYCKKIPSES